MAKGKQQSKQTKKSKIKTSSKVKTKTKSKEKAKAIIDITGFMPKATKVDLSSFYAKAAKLHKPKKKKLTRKEIINNYQNYQQIITDFEEDRNRQFEFRHTIKAGSDSAYRNWVRGLPNAREYPENRKAWLQKYDELSRRDTETGKILTAEQGGDGRLMKFGRGLRKDYRMALAEVPTLEKKYDYLPEEAVVKEVKGLTQKAISERTDVGVTGYLTKDVTGNDIEITHLINYQPSAIPIYENPNLEELAKTDKYGDIDLSYNSRENQAIIRHRWMQPIHWNAFVDVIRKYGFTYDKQRRMAVRSYDEKEVANTVKDFRESGLDVEVSPSIPVPQPIELKKPAGDDRFDIFLDVDRTSFRVKVDGHRAKEFLQELDYDTKEEMRAPDKLAYLKEHPEAKLKIVEYKKTLKLEGKKLEDNVDKFIMKELSGYLPRDGHWHFVNKEEQTIPIGFVYHYVLEKDAFNVKIKDNRPLYLDERSPVEPAMIDHKTGESFKLRDYQEQAIESAIDKKSGIIAAATGSGKTEIGAFIVAGQGLDAVWFAHRGELINQAEKRMEQRLGVNVGAYGGGSKEILNTSGMDINVMTVQSASTIMRKPRAEHQQKVSRIANRVNQIKLKIDRESNEQKKHQLERSLIGREEELSKAKLKLEVYDFVQQANVQIFDESHHLTSLQFGDIARATPQARYRYGLSATPWGNTSTDQKRIEALMGKAVVEITATKLINEGYLAKPNILMVSIPHMVDPLYPVYVYHEKGKKKGQLKKVASDDNDLSFHELKKVAVVRNQVFNDYVVDFTEKCQKTGLNTMVLVQEVEHGKLVQKKLADDGISSDFLNATTHSDEEQKVILNRFRAGKKDVLVATFGKAGEGVDIPGLDVVILADAYKALVPTMQAVGRAMRIPQGSDKKECLIVDFDRKEKHYGYHPSKDSHVEERMKVYSFEPAFDVKKVSVSQVDDEIADVARINKVKQRKKLEDLGFSESEEFLFPKERTEKRFLERSTERMERIGTLKKTRKGRKLVVSQRAKNVTKRHSNISPVYAQQILNVLTARELDYQTIDWDKVDSSLEPSEAIRSAKII
jgi:superfamily II DNA or RNA helicase